MVILLVKGKTIQEILEHLGTVSVEIGHDRKKGTEKFSDGAEVSWDIYDPVCRCGSHDFDTGFDYYTPGVKPPQLITCKKCGCSIYGRLI